MKVIVALLAGLLLLLFPSFADSTAMSITLIVANIKYENSSITLTKDVVTSVGASPVNVTLDIITTSNLSDATLDIAKAYDQIETTNGTASKTIMFAIIITPSSNLSANLNNSLVKLYYNTSDLSTTSGTLDENTLTVYFWNTSTNSWVTCSQPHWNGCLSSGRNTADKFVWANVTHFSSFAIYGELMSSSQQGGGGGGGVSSSQVTSSATGECIEYWVCSDWDPCRGSIQTRQCGDWSNCGTAKNKPPTEKTCLLWLAESEIIPQEAQPPQPEPFIPPKKESPKEPATVPLKTDVLLIVFLLSLAGFSVFFLSYKNKKRKISKHKK